MLKRLTSAILPMLFTSSLGLQVWAQEPEIPAAPVPPSIARAKSVFVSNGGEESNFMDVRYAWYSGGPNRAYNQFYAALKAWGKYALAPEPGDADLVFEIAFNNKSNDLSQIKLVIVDPKTHVTLWTVTKYAQVAGMAKNREKNYNLAMGALVDDLKALVSTPPSAATQK